MKKLLSEEELITHMNTNGPVTYFNEKKGYIELLRILAILLVIYNHTRNWGFELYQFTSEKSSYWFSIIMIPLCKIAVPLFLMISGVTLLSKKETYKEVLKKRVCRHIIIILLFSTLQFLRFVRTGKVEFTFLSWLKGVYSNPILETYWFLYLYLGFLLLLPFFQKIGENIEKEEIYYLFGLNVISCILAVIGYYSGYFINGYVFSLPIILFYPLMGFGIDKYMKESDWKKNGIFTLFSCFLIVILSVIYFQMNSNQNENFKSLLQVFTPIIACGFFGTIKTFYYKIQNKNIDKLTTKIGSTVFGVYLIEDITRNQLEKIIKWTSITVYLNDFIVAILFTSFTFIISSVIVYIIMKWLSILKNFININK